MAVVFSYSSAAGKSEGKPTHCVCDFASELPTTSTIGDTAFCKETGYFYKSTASGSWTNQGSGGGGGDFSDLTGTASVAQGGTGASNAPSARTNLGLGSLATADSVSFVDVTGSVSLGAQSGYLPLTHVTGTLSVASGGTGAANASTARTNLGLGSLATQSGTFSGTSSGTNTGDVSLSGTPDYITISGQVITRGDVDLASDITGTLSVARGGTGQSNAASARTALGLGDVATLNTNASTENFLRGDGSWITPSAGSVAASDITGSLSLLTQSGQLRLSDGVLGTLAVQYGGTGAANATSARSNLGLGLLATANSVAFSDVTGSISLGAQSGDLQLTDVSGTLAVANGGTGAANAASARTNLGLGSISTLSSVTLVTNTSGTLSVAQGGTGASSGSAAYTNLGQMAASNISGSISLVAQSGLLPLATGTSGSLSLVAQTGLLPAATGLSGTIAAANLGGGTADSTTYLRGDKTWATPSGGSNPFTMVRKTGLDQGASGTSLLNSVNQMDFTLTANTNYVFEYWVRYQTAATTTGLVLGLQTAIAPVGLWMMWTTPLAATGTVTGGSAIGSNTTLSIASGDVAAGGVQLAYLTGMVIAGASSGTISLRWCSEVTGSMCTIKTGTMGRIMQIT